MHLHRHQIPSAMLLTLLVLAGTPAEAQRPSIAQLQARIASLEADNVPNLHSYLSMDTSNASRPTLRLTAANLQVVNGQGATDTVNGLGNIIVGYDESRPGNDPSECTAGNVPTQTACAQIGGAWIVNQKTGSHSVVVGSQHNYTYWAGVVTGLHNGLYADYATVSGNLNRSYGSFASVTGGTLNVASNEWSSVSGGTLNRADGPAASVSGGTDNYATMLNSSVSGGEHNVASGANASVSGGDSNQATATDSNVSGGNSNRANGTFSSVSGGALRTASGQTNWAAGGLFQSQ
jgi:hypothetical protein